MASTAAPFSHCAGPRSARIAIVGEAPGANEELLGAPFVGQAGSELARLLGETGLTAAPPQRFLDQLFLMSWWSQQPVFLTNVFTHRPTGNEIESFCCSKAEAGGASYTLPPLRLGKYFRPELLELDRLREELEMVQPNLVLALGNSACWALFRQIPKIGSIRGVPAEARLVPGLKVLPTYHPAAVLRNFALRPVVKADFLKSRREAEFPEVRRPRREVLISPEIWQICEWCQLPASAYAVDIETSGTLIEMVGFARSATSALIIPFINPDGTSYWRSEFDERIAWGFVAKLLASPVPKIFQNGLFDLQHLWRMGFPVQNCLHDTMLLHHSLYLELQKRLGFLGSVYTDERSWKLMRKGGAKLEE